MLNPSFQHAFLTQHQPKPALTAGLGDVSLVSLLELVHSTGQTGVVELELFLERCAVPFQIVLRHGEVVGAHLYDWEGTDALYSIPQDAGQGRFSFYPLPAETLPHATALGSFEHLMGEWARLSDEWPLMLEVLGSPSAVYSGPFAAFLNGASARTAALASGQPLHSIASQMSDYVQAGQLEPMLESSWHGMVLPALTDPEVRSRSPLLSRLDGKTALGELFSNAEERAELRRELLREIQRGYAFTGYGWLTRDLIWERAAAEREPTKPLQAAD